MNGSPPEGVRPLPPRSAFLRRLGRGAAISCSILAAGLGIGVVGYHACAGLGWLDAFLNAAMLLGGQGPVDRMETPAAKWFAAFYAMFGGLVFVTVAGVMLAPVIHRFLHRFHIEDFGEE